MLLKYPTMPASRGVIYHPAMSDQVQYLSAVVEVLGQVCVSATHVRVVIVDAVSLRTVQRYTIVSAFAVLLWDLRASSRPRRWAFGHLTPPYQCALLTSR